MLRDPMMNMSNPQATQVFRALSDPETMNKPTQIKEISSNIAIIVILSEYVLRNTLPSLREVL